MKDNRLYQDIAKRTDGDIYVGVVGPVRTGKSTFIKRFMDLLVIPNIDNEYKKERAQDELPQSAGGRTIMTTEPKFIPNEAVAITVGDNINLNVRLVDWDIETEVSPIVGSEKQSQELVESLLSEFESDPKKIWESNIFWKSLHELVNEGLQSKLMKMPEDAQEKLQETLERIINEGSGGLICIIL